MASRALKNHARRTLKTFMQNITYVSEGEDGHRAEYNRLFLQVLESLNMHLNHINSARLPHNASDVMFYPMLDSAPLDFLARAVARSLMGRKTAGLLFRPGECFLKNSLKYRIKYILFRMASRFPHVHILSLIPFEVSPDFSVIATDWLYDPQLWDLKYFGVPETESFPELDRQLQTVAYGRRLVIALGGQNRIKGFDCFTQVWSASQKLRDDCLFVAAGKVSAESSAHAKRFATEGGLLLDQRIEDNEFIHLYRRAHVIWSCYAPDYNQASGIHGRAVQLGVPVAVREGSYLEGMEKMLAHPTLALPFDAPSVAAEKLAQWRPDPADPDRSAAKVEEMWRHSLAALRKALKVEDK